MSILVGEPPVLKTEMSREGLSFLDQLRKEWARAELPHMMQTKVVGAFGIIHDDGFVNTMFWVVSHRKDRRHGVVDRPDKKSDYVKSLEEGMFRNW